MKTKFILLWLLFFSINVSTAQQWYLSSPLFFGRDVNSIQIFNRSSVLLAGGEDPLYRTFYSSNNYGASWNIVSDVFNYWVLSEAFRDSLNGFSVGENGTLLKTVNGGAFWSTVTAPVIKDFNKVIYTNTQTLFAVGGHRYADSSQVILKSTNDGNNWSIVYNQPGKWLKSICFTDTLHGIAVGDSAVILKTVNGGNNWTPVTAPVQRDFNGVTFVNTSTGFIVGGKEVNDSMRTILKTTDGGNTWSIIKDASGGWLKDITFTDQNTGYAVGDKACLLKTINAGQNWNQQTVNGTTGNETFNAVKFFDPNFGVVGGKAGKALVYTDATQPELGTAAGSYIDSTIQVVKGLVNTHGTPTECYMNFSTSPSFSPLYTSYSQFTTSDTFVNVGVFLTGLTPNTTYYYRLVVKSILGTQIGVTRSFYTWTPRYTVETYPAANITLGTAIISGRVDKLFEPITPFVTYSTFPSLTGGITVTQLVDNGQINDTLPHNITAYITGLSANTTYYYTLSVQTPYGVISGDTHSFTTYASGYSFRSLPPDNITATSATIKGEVDKLTEPVNLFFEYDTVPNFTRTITATPAVVNDSAYHLVSANLTGLQPFTVYYYWLRGTANGTPYYGQPVSFFTNDYHFQVQTLPATDTTLLSTVLLGSVNKFLYPCNLFFDYGTGPQFGQTIMATPAFVSDSNLHNVSANISGLTPGNTYYYQLRAVSNGVTFYGGVHTFFIGDPFSYIKADPATFITGNGAQINGSVAGLLAAATVNFQYAITPSNWITAPSSMSNINDTLPHTVYAQVTGLSPERVYYYRLAVSLAGETFYSNIRQFYTGNSPIPNWDFQYWSEDTSLLPEAWNLVDNSFEQVPGHSGNYGLKVKGNGITIMGLIDGSRGINNRPGIYGGVPFHARPDSLVFYAITDFAAGDSGEFILYLYRDTTAVALNFFSVGGSSGGYQRFAFPISYSASGLPDSLVLAFMSFKLFGSYMPSSNSLTVDDIGFSPPAAPVYNADMEHWFSHPHSTLLNWAYPKYLLPGSGLNQVSKTLFNQPADYALEITNINAYGNWLGSEVNSNQSIFANNAGGFPVNTRHQTLNGYYKCYPTNGDTLDINVRFLLGGNVIGYGQLLQTDSVPQFTAFDIPITYYYLQFPEYAIVSMKAYGKVAKGPSRLIVDKLSFDGFTSINDNLWASSASETGLKIYPNPTKDRVIIEAANEIREGDYVQLFNLNGQLLYQINLTAGQTKTELNMADLNAGFYLLNVNTGNRLLNGKVVVVK